MPQRTKNQHYVPQFILRAFSESNSRLHVFDKKARRSFTSSPKNVASENGFYDFRIGDERGTLEPLMCETEQRTAPVINRLVSRRSLSGMTHQDRSFLAKFVAIQSLRTLANREFLTQLDQQLERVLPTKGVQHDQIRALVDNGAESVKHQSMYNLGIARDLAPALMKKIWYLSSPAGKKRFLLSDNPVVKWNHLKPDPFMSNHGFESVGIELSMPLAPTLCLSFLCPQIVRRLRNLQNQTRRAAPRLAAIQSKSPEKLPSADVDHLNRLQLAGASRFVFSDEDDFEEVDQLVEQYPQIVTPIRVQAG